MSDAPQGDGWWLAADGKYYPPEVHPSRAMTPPPPPPAAPAPQFAPPVAAPAFAAAPPARTRGIAAPQIVAIVAAAVTFACAFLPWATVSTLFGSISVSGFQNGEGDGLLTVILAAIGGLCAWKGGKALIVSVIAGALCAVIGIYDWGNINDIASDPEAFGIAEVGIGLIGTVIGGIALGAAAIAGLVTRRRQAA